MNKHAAREMKKAYKGIGIALAILAAVCAVIGAFGYAAWWVNWHVGTGWAWSMVLVPIFIAANAIPYFTLAAQDKAKTLEQRIEAEYQRRVRLSYEDSFKHPYPSIHEVRKEVMARR